MIGQIRIRTWYEVEIERPGGVRGVYSGHNAITDYMPTYVSDAMCRAGAAETVLGGIAVGTDTTVATSTHSDVFSQVDWQTLDAGFPKNDYATYTNKTAWQATWGAASDTITDITEACVKATTGGTDAISRWMWSTGTTKTLADTLTIRLLWGYTT